MDPVRLQTSGGFSRVDIRHIHKIVEERQRTLREAWDEYFRP
ncbi:MAG: hypothetical protein OEZ41_13375 [Nitrospirota bacterium]|nr:hypothetical protein [Nitrospirota bacterium]